MARFGLGPRLSSRYGRALPANLTSGGRISPPRSRIRDGRAPIGRHHSIRRRFRTRPDNGDTPLDPRAHAAPQSGLNSAAISPPDSRSRLPAPRPASRTAKGDQEPARHRHHHYFAHAAPCAANALAKPADLSRAGLITLPEPSQLDHHGSQPSVASFADPLLTLRGPATERRRGEPGVGAECLAVGEFAHERFSYKHGGALHSNPP